MKIFVETGQEDEPASLNTELLAEKSFSLITNIKEEALLVPVTAVIIFLMFCLSA